MNLAYDFTFAEHAICFIETGDSYHLEKIAELDAADHIFDHASRFNHDVPTSSKLNLVNHLLTPVGQYKKTMPQITRNLEFAKAHIASTGIAEEIALQFLPKDSTFSGTMFFTLGYDIGVAYGENCSLNVAHPIFIKNMSEMKYYAIHELHHIGFTTLKGGYMPTLEISTRREMAHVIEYLTHMEGMGTYAPLATREQESAMNTDHDYIVLQDSKMMDDLVKEYLEIYRHFKNNPDERLVEEDWHKIGILSDIKRLWYVVGAHMAKTIDHRLGRERLVGLIAEPSENFIAAY